jgi:ABC-type phosphate/phosphonate transport system ATPase subunit
MRHNYKVMIKRALEPAVSKLLSRFPAVAILGPRQVGKTTVFQSLAGTAFCHAADLPSVCAITSRFAAPDCTHSDCFFILDPDD